MQQSHSYSPSSLQESVHKDSDGPTITVFLGKRNLILKIKILQTRK